MEVFVESQSETFCSVWCPGLWRSSTAKGLRLPQHFLSTHYQRELAASALRTSSRRSLASMRRPEWSIDGVGAFDLISRNAMLQALLEINGGDGGRGTRSCLSSDSFMDDHRHMCRRTRWERSMTLLRERAASRATP